jgi:ketosteroid isomerase-like protein
VYPVDIVAFDAIQAVRFVGRQAYEDHWNACLAYSSGPMIFRIHDLALEASGDVAFCHGLVRCGGTGPDGEVKTGWMRMTLGLRREAGRWRIVHEHHSAPFGMEDFKALFELEPEGTPKALVA